MKDNYSPKMQTQLKCNLRSSKDCKSRSLRWENTIDTMVRVTQIEERIVRMQTIQTTLNASSLTFLRWKTWEEAGFMA